MFYVFSKNENHCFARKYKYFSFIKASRNVISSHWFSIKNSLFLETPPLTCLVFRLILFDNAGFRDPFNIRWNTKWHPKFITTCYFSRSCMSFCPPVDGLFHDLVLRSSLGTCPLHISTVFLLPACSILVDFGSHFVSIGFHFQSCGKRITDKARSP